MRVSGATVQKFLLGMALLSALVWNLAHASEINDLRLDSGATGTRAEIALDQSVEYKVIRLSAPDRLVVDLPATRIRRGMTLPAGAGVVKSVRTGQPEPGTARIVFDLSQPVAVLNPRIEQSAGGPRLVLEWPGDGEDSAAAATASTTATRTPADQQVSASTPQPETAATATPQTTRDDDVAASNAATTRLISELASRGEMRALAMLPKPVPGTTSSPTAGSPATATVNGSTVPVRIATGVPAPVSSAISASERPVQGTPPSNAPSSTTTASATPPEAVKSMKDLMRGRGMRPLVIAIDAGHGGQDPGAIGLAGKREKDVTLAIARELARQINATPGLKAYLTRDTDVFIPLNRRAQLARQARADMFVSIHADAAENRSANGSSVYVLSLKGASSQRARWLADKENASDLIGGVRLEKTSSALASVLIDLTQSGRMKASEDAAAHVLNGLSRIGRNHKPHIERANFAVLRTSDMPAMLVETAFISNPDEERRLSNPTYQRQLARAVLDGVNTYFLRQPPPGTLYAAQAAATMAPVAGAGGGSP